MAFWTTILISAAIVSISAVGLFLQLRSGQLNVGMAVFVGLGGYVAGAVSINFPVSPMMTLPVAVIAGFLVGMLFAGLTLRLHRWFFAVTTLTLSVAAGSGFAMIQVFGGPMGLTNIPIHTGPLLAFGSLAGTLLVAYAIERSHYGLAIRATGDDQELAEVFGVHVKQLRMFVFGIGTAMGALAGALHAHRFGIVQPTDVGVYHSLMLLVYVIVGGKRHLLGPILGTFFLFVTPEVIKIAPEAHLIVVGMLLIIVGTWLPDGLAGWLSRGVGRLKIGLASFSSSGCGSGKKCGTPGNV